MMTNDKVNLFENQPIRTVWVEFNSRFSADCLFRLQKKDD